MNRANTRTAEGSEFLSVADQLMRTEGRALSAKELVDLGFERGLFSDKICGKTPDRTMNARLSTHIRKLGRNSHFVRTKPGRFYLRQQISSADAIYEAARFEPPRSTERVLVFPTEWLEKDGRFQGISGARTFNRLMASRSFSYRERWIAETTDSEKQIVTYVLVTQGQNLLSYRRGNYSRAESFLKGAYCIGFGGHVSDIDRNLITQKDFGVAACAARELMEELRLPLADRRRLERGDGLKLLGVLNDDSSPNGQRHLAVLFRYEVSNDPSWQHPRSNERSVTQLRWLNPNRASTSLFEFEYWSQLCLLKFYKSADLTRPKFNLRRPSALRPPRILCVIGKLGSGKTECVTHLTSRYSYTEINSGLAVAELLGMPPVDETTRDAFQEAAWEFISSDDGPRRLASHILAAAAESDRGRTLIDGIRQRRTLEALRKQAGRRGIGVIYIHTPANIAFEFYKQRTGGEATIQDFLRVRNSQVEQDVDRMIEDADAVLYNWRGRLSYRNTIDAMMRDARVGL